jgi:dephospho-CoA kinase
MLIFLKPAMHLKKVIGVVGDIGSGKDAVLKYLNSKYGIPYLSTGDIVRQIAEREGVEATRENLETISRQCFQDMGKGCFVKMAASEIINRGWSIAGISGVRSPDDVEVMKDMFGKNFVLIRVDIKDPRLRFERLRRRNEERDPQTYEDFLLQDSREELTFKISNAERMADYTLSNDGPLQDLHRHIDLLVEAEQLLRV